MPDNSTGDQNFDDKDEIVNPFDESTEEQKKKSKEELQDIKEDLPSHGPFEPPVKPINPFEDIPDRDEEEFYKNGQKEEQVEVPEEIVPNEDIFEEKETVKPINPFEDTFEKPLDEMKEEAKTSAYEEEKSAEEMDYSKEEEVQPIEGEIVSNDSEDKESEDKTSNEPVEVNKSEVLFTEEPNTAESENIDFKEEIWDILDKAGIGKGTIIFAVIGIGVLIGLFIWFIFGIGGDGEDGGQIVDNGTQQEPSGDISSIITSFIIGLENRPIDVIPIGEFGTDAGVIAAIALGIDEGFSEVQFVNYFDTLRQMENAFNTDVYGLVNNATNRREALNNFIAQIQDLLLWARQYLADIDASLATLEQEYQLVTQERQVYEEQFFINMDQLQGQNALQNLERFIDYSERAVEIRAKFNALQTVYSRLSQLLAFLEPRLRDIELNKEALIQGVRVFDVPRSDIDAIVPVESE